MRRRVTASIAFLSTLLIVLSSVGTVSALEAPGPCKDVGIAGFWNSISISGSFPDNYEACDIKGFHIYRGTDPEDLTLHYTMTLQVIPIFKIFFYQDAEINNGVKYYYSVAAFNSDGDGPRSEVLEATCKGVPPAPQNLTYEVTSTSVTLTWDVPPSDGGKPITNYSVFRDYMNEGSVWIGNTTSLTFTDNTIVPGAFYIYRVGAVNEYGLGKLAWADFITTIPVITGRIVYEDGSPVVGAKVELDNNTTVATTDENGTFELETMFGQYNMTVWVEGRATFSQIVTSMIDVNDLGNITLARATNEGPATDLTMIVLVGAAIGAAGLVGAFLFVRRKK